MSTGDMSNRLRVLDLCCNIGAASKGYENAGLSVTGGVDIVQKDRYPYPFVKADAISFLKLWIAGRHRVGADLVHVSPPCQARCALTVGTNASRGWGRTHVDLVPQMRELLDELGLPYVMEQPVGKSGLRPDVVLCGEMFRTEGSTAVLRHRVFELGGWKMTQPPHRKHQGYVRGWRHGVYRTGPYVAAYGAGGGKATVPEMQEAMGIHWTDVRRELTEALPVAFTECIGRGFLEWAESNRQERQR